MPDRRIIDDGVPLPYTCHNKRFKTDIKKGFQHNTSNARGSVLAKPLLLTAEFSLWLEYVIPTSSDEEELFWLMWYDNDGYPTIPMSSVFKKEHLKQMVTILLSKELQF